MALNRDARRLSLIAGLILALVICSFKYLDQSRIESFESPLNEWVQSPIPGHSSGGALERPEDSPSLSTATNTDTTARPTAPPITRPGDGSGDSTHYTIYSLARQDGRYFDINFNNLESINPNVIPHPRLNDTWYIISQKNMTVLEAPYFVEIYCSAKFTASGVLECIDTPYNLPISATFSDKCPENLAVLGLNVGPHDARVFYGPESPLITYGSNSQLTCFGQWVQDFRLLVEWGVVNHAHTVFRSGTELQRPPPWHEVEKNFFLFWDENNQTYVHNDVAPARVFAKLGEDGAVGDNLGTRTAQSDDKCMARFLPKMRGKLEAIHQATNSLSITLCNRTEPTCRPTEENTFLFAIIHHKSHYNDHSNYEPYLMMFRRREPFELYAISSKPMWVHGRQAASDMFFITSMSWKAQGQKYHGYLDDALFLAFGIEDRRTGGMDMLAGNLFQGLGLCEGATPTIGWPQTFKADS